MEATREIVLNTLDFLENITSEKAKKICEKLFIINKKYNLGLENAIRYHLIKDNKISA